MTVVYISRLNAALEPDLDFGGGDGWTILQKPVCYDETPEPRVHARPALMGDGRVVIAGSGYLARLTPDGEYDPTFGGGDGLLEGPAVVDGLAVAEDGRIVLGGQGEDGLEVHRFLVNGDSDPSFGTDGTAFLPLVEGLRTIGGGLSMPDGSPPRRRRCNRVLRRDGPVVLRNQRRHGEIR